MARSSSPAETLLKELLAQAVSPALKDAGFGKSALSYHRRHGETVQVVNVQVSHGSTAFEKQFFVNVGIAFDAVCRLMDLPVPQRPKEYECDARGTRDRLEKLIPDCPEKWVVRAGEGIDGIVGPLRRAIEQLSAELNRIDGLEAYRHHPWFDRFRPARSNAQMLHLLGEPEEAWREVQDLVRLFADRQNPPDARWFVQRLRLGDLGERDG